MISIDRIKRIAQDIINDDEWVNDSHSKAEHDGIRNGLERLLNHLDETKKRKDPGYKEPVQLTVKTLIERLSKVKDKSLPIRIATPFDDDELIDVNLWLIDEGHEHSTGMSGY